MRSGDRKECHVVKHHYEVAEASSHHEKMEYLMGAEVLVAGVEYRQLEGVYYAADCIYNSAG